MLKVVTLNFTHDCILPLSTGRILSPAPSGCLWLSLRQSYISFFLPELPEAEYRVPVTMATAKNTSEQILKDII